MFEHVYSHCLGMVYMCILYSLISLFGCDANKHSTWHNVAVIPHALQGVELYAFRVIVDHKRVIVRLDKLVVRGVGMGWSKDGHW